MDDLEKYSEQVESLYETLRGFRHDYTNVLISLSEAIQMRDIDQIKMIYDTVLKDSASDLRQQKFDLAKLTHVTNMPLKSLLSSKLAEAFDKGIHCHVEVEEGVFFTDMRVLDLITITSILCDNAIEAAVLSETPKLSIAIFKMEGQSVIAVENSTKEASIDIAPLKQRGFSTKGTGRGLGLANIEEILFRYDNVSLETESAQHRFVQLLSYFYLSGVRVIGMMIGSRSVFSYRNGRNALTIAPLTDCMLASLFLRAIRIALNRIRWLSRMRSPDSRM